MIGAHTCARIEKEYGEPVSELMVTTDSAYLRGVAKLGERLGLLLDLARILGAGEQKRLAA